jgi:peptidoglycan/xylan/chitin deacetylase (PgdA/CDA1 family)
MDSRCLLFSHEKLQEGGEQQLMQRYHRSIVMILLVLMFLFIATTMAGTNAVVTEANLEPPTVCPEVPVLNYHKIDTMQIALSVAPEEFDKQMQYLSENGYHTVTPDQLFKALKKGIPLPDKPILITFDDGYEDNYVNAYPILKKYNFTATFFVITDFISHDPRFMTWDQVKEMAENGFTIGSHTVNHVPLTELNADQITTELTASSQKLEQELGVRPRYFAYPTGTYNDEIRHLVQKAGYKMAFTVRYGQADSDSNFYSIERIPIFRTQHTFRSFFIRVKAAPILERLGLIRN